MTKKEQRFLPQPNIVFTKLDDREAALLDLKTQRYYSLNETGSRIWDLLQSGNDARTIATCMITDYEVTEAELLTVIQEYLDELHQEGLIKTDD